MGANAGSRPRPRTISNPRDTIGRPIVDTQAIGAGAGFAGTGSLHRTSIERVGGIIVTRILVDLTGLNSSTTDLDIIGNSGGGVAYIARITAAENGTIVGGFCQCLEAPTGGVTDIDLYAATEGTGVFDGGIGALAETAVVTSGGAWTLSRIVGAGADSVVANAYLYMTSGAAGTAGTYTAGRLLYTFYGI